MESILRDKFYRHKDLRKRLQATQTRPLLNSYNDATVSNLFWGVLKEQGKNHLGRILENIRFDIIKNLDLERWLYFTFDLLEKKEFIPGIKIAVKKQGEQIATIELNGKPFYTMGCLPINDM